LKSVPGFARAVFVPQGEGGRTSLCLPTDDNDTGRKAHRKSGPVFKLIGYKTAPEANGSRR